MGRIVGKDVSEWREVRGIGEADRKRFQALEARKGTTIMSKWYQGRVVQNYQQNNRYRSWEGKTEEERLANVLYPHLSSKDDQQTMREIASSEGRKAPRQSKLLSNKERAFVSPLGGTVRSK